jgi:hypothetical protein
LLQKLLLHYSSLGGDCKKSFVLAIFVFCFRNLLLLLLLSQYSSSFILAIFFFCSVTVKKIWVFVCCCELQADGTEELVDNGPYHSRQVFEANYEEMKRKVKVFVYPHDDNDTYRDIYRAWDKTPTGNYASEAYFKQALMKSSFVTSNAAEADFFFMPVSITRARIDKRVGTEGVKEFCKQHVSAVQREWSFWNRSGGVDHFYLSCHSIARTAMELVPQVRRNASVPQIWPREGATPDGVKHTAQR